MTNRRALAAALIITTALGGSAFAAEQIVRHGDAQAKADQAAVDKDVGKLSKDGAQGLRDLELSRLAIYNADPALAKDAIAKAQTAFTKAKTDDTVFTKAESELKTSADLAIRKGSAQAAKADAKPADKEPFSIPIVAISENEYIAPPRKQFLQG